MVRSISSSLLSCSIPTSNNTCPTIVVKLLLLNTLCYVTSYYHSSTRIFVFAKFFLSSSEQQSPLSANIGLEDSLQKIGIPLLGIICSPSTALKLLNEGLLPDCRIYAIILDDSMYPEHMADVQAIKDSLPNVLLNLVDSNSIGPLRQFHFQHVKKTTKSMSVRRTGGM